MNYDTTQGNSHSTINTITETSEQSHKRRLRHHTFQVDGPRSLLRVGEDAICVIVSFLDTIKQVDHKYNIRLPRAINEMFAHLMGYIGHV